MEPHVFDRCPDCAIEVGQRHRPGCDVARCHFTGMQMLSCWDKHEPDCFPDRWTGTWPGDAAARRFGWYIAGTQMGDLNLLYTKLMNGEVRWNPDIEDFELVA